MSQLETAELDLPALFDAAADVLARVLPHDAACWHAMDPATLIETSTHVEHMPPPDPRVAEIAYLSSDFNSFPELARRPRHSGVLSEETGGDLRRSTRYRELLVPVNMAAELRVACVVDHASWACFALFRQAPATDFTEDERDFAHDVAASLGRSFRAAGVRARAGEPGVGLWPGVLLIGRDHRLESATPSALGWLRQVGFLGDPGHDPLPFEVLNVAERARVTAGEVAARVLGASGRWVALHAEPTAGDEDRAQRVAVVLQAAAPPSIAPLICAAYGLTTRERELTELVLRGFGTTEIAARLFVSPHTVQSHLKSIFAKVGVRSRRQLVGRLVTGEDGTARPG